VWGGEEETQQGLTGSKHQGRAKLTVDQSVANFQGWTAYVEEGKTEDSLPWAAVSGLSQKVPI
jgi:hypothetical protein